MTAKTDDEQLSNSTTHALPREPEVAETLPAAFCEASSEMPPAPVWMVKGPVVESIATPPVPVVSVKGPVVLVLMPALAELNASSPPSLPS